MANIFQFATSELSQDAFLCWLFASLGGDKDGVFKRTDDEQVYKVARFVLFKFLDLEDSPDTKVALSWVEKQWKYLDVAVDVFIDNELYVLGIEDKTRSYIHNSSGTKECQLKKYRSDLLAFWKNDKSNKKRGYFAKPEHIKTIVYKTSFFSEVESKKVDGWDYFDIEKIIELFREIIQNPKEVHNVFLRDYLEYLYLIDDTFKEDSNIYNWDVDKNRAYDISWEKFYIDLNDSITDIGLYCECSFFRGKYLDARIECKCQSKPLPCVYFAPREFIKKNGDRRILFCLRFKYDLDDENILNDKEYIDEILRKMSTIKGISFKRSKRKPKYDIHSKGKNKKYTAFGNFEVSLNEITNNKTIIKKDLKKLIKDNLSKIYSVLDESLK